MNKEDSLPFLSAARSYFNNGAMRSYKFRKAQLQKLKQAILDNEAAINAALYNDLKKTCPPMPALL